MGKVRRYGIKTARHVAAGPVLPTWVKALPIILGAIMFLLVSSALFTDRSVVTRDQDATSLEIGRIARDANSQEVRALYEWATTGTAPAAASSDATAASAPSSAPQESEPTTPDSLVDNPVGTSAPAAGTVPLLDRAGVVIAVDTNALAAARSATEALFTGRFETVTLASGVQLPTLPRVWDDPYVGEPSVASVGDGVVSIAFVVDPDRDGPAQPREIVTSVESTTPTTWAWLGV